jgi:large subunit ribosomal protein L19
MQSVIKQIEEKYKKHQVVDVRPGDTVKVHQKIKEGNKERIQIFEGLVIRVAKKNSHTSTIAVRRIASGVGVEKTYLLHSPLVVKVEVVKRSKVRRNYLSYMRKLTGKSARLTGVSFDKETVNKIEEEPEEAVEEDKSEEPKAKTEKPAQEKAEKSEDI